MGNNFERKRSSSSSSTPCSGFVQAFKWIPVLFISAVIAWSYYAYVYQLCILTVDNVMQEIFFLIFYHVLFVLFLWSYYKCTFSKAATVPSNWRLTETDLDRLLHAENQDIQKRILESVARELPITNRALDGSVRFCEKCKVIKPDRAHHCSVCGSCILKMDHHCPWVNNCVNFANYKFFILFLGYALLYCLYVALTSLQYFIAFWRNELNGGMGRFHILFLFFVSLMFAISLVSLFGYHIYLVLMNRTTLEAFRAPIFRVGGPDKNGFNLGKLANFQEVFGDNWKLWFVPIYTSLGDGILYPLSAQQRMHASATYESMGSTQTRLDLTQATDKLIANDNNAGTMLNGIGYNGNVVTTSNSINAETNSNSAIVNIETHQDNHHHHPNQNHQYHPDTQSHEQNNPKILNNKSLSNLNDSFHSNNDHHQYRQHQPSENRAQYKDDAIGPIRSGQYAKLSSSSTALMPSNSVAPLDLQTTPSTSINIDMIQSKKYQDELSNDNDVAIDMQPIGLPIASSTAQVSPVTQSSSSSSPDVPLASATFGTPPSDNKIVGDS